MRIARWCTFALVVVLVPVLLGACSGAPGSDAERAPGSASAGDSDTALPTDVASPQPATGQPSSGSGSGGSTSGGSTLPPLEPPSGAPRTPSDLIPLNVLVGTIMADSDGSCYTLQTDDGDTYALVGGDRRPLSRGTVVRAKTTQNPPPAAPGCVGQPVAISSIEPVS